MRSYISAELINRKTGKSYTGDGRKSRIKLSLNIFNFTDVFDFRIPISLRDGIPKISSHDFVEFYLNIEDEKYQIGVGYMDDLLKTSNPSEVFASANGKDFLGRLLEVPFKKTLYSKESTMVSLIKTACKNEYIEEYHKFKGSSGYIVDLRKTDPIFLASSDQSQKKGQIIQSSADLGMNLVFQNRLGQVVLIDKDTNLGAPVGKLIKAKGRSNIETLAVRSSFSQTISDATIFYNSSEKNVDRGATPSRKVINSDKRVNGLIYKPFYDTFNVSDINHFAGRITPEKRIDDVARSKVRTSNRNLNNVVITSSNPYLFDKKSGALTPFKIGQVWDIESELDEFITNDFPDGTNEVEMVLTGINYEENAESIDTELMFSERNTLI